MSNLKQNIVIIGSSGHAKVVIDIIEKQDKYRIIGLIDSFRQVGEQTLGYPVLGSEAELPILLSPMDIQGFFVAIGDNAVRRRVAESILQMLPQLPAITAVHPSAQVARGAVIGAGTAVMAGVTINTDSQLGRFVIANTHTSIDHDCHIGDFATIAPGAVLGGGVKVGVGAIVSLGAQVIHNISIGEHALVGAGATVVRPVEPFGVAYGNPARTVRQRKEGDKYL